MFKSKGYKIFPKKILWEEIFNKYYLYNKPILYTGIPVFKSEETCILLLQFSVEKKLSIGVHYCSHKNEKYIKDQILNKHNGA